MPQQLLKFVSELSLSIRESTAASSSGTLVLRTVVSGIGARSRLAELPPAGGFLSGAQQHIVSGAHVNCRAHRQRSKIYFSLSGVSSSRSNEGGCKEQRVRDQV
jgi:hypothetical protein